MKKTKKALASLAIAGMAMTMVPFNAFADDAVSTRLSGNTAVQTAQAISQDGWTTSINAIIAPATAYNMADALAAAPLAAALNAPVLLTAGDQLSAETKAEITRLGVTKVYVASGSAVIKAGVIADLEGMGVTVVKLGGFDQYETSVNIAKEIAKISPTTSIFIANGESARVAQDALSVAAVAGAQKQPLLLTQKGQLPKVVADYIDSIKANVNASYITGGTGVVSDAVKAKLPGTVYRNAGYDAYDTNLEVLKNFTDFDFGRTFVANGETMIDALAGAPLAAQTKSPIVLVSGSVKTATTDFLKTKASTTITALGGTAVVPENLITMIANPDKIKVTSAAGTTSSVYEGKADQVLAFTVGGVAKTVSEMEAAGYTVEFQATEPVFAGGEYESTDGYLDESGATVVLEGLTFEYTVGIFKDGAAVVTSDAKKVTVKDAATGTDAIESYNIYLGDDDDDFANVAKVSSKTLTLDDQAYIRVRGTDAGSAFGSITETAKYSSSDPSIAYVDKGGETKTATDTAVDVEDTYVPIVLGGSTGTVTITITASSGAKETLNLKVVDEERTPSASKTVIDKTVPVKLSTGATQQFGVTVNDQFGDPIKGYQISVKAATSGNNAIAACEDEPEVTTKKGRVTVEVTGGADYGTGTLTIKDEDNNTLGTVSASNTDAVGTASKYKMNLLPFKVDTLDINSTSDFETTYSVDAYDSKGYKLSEFDTALTLKVDGKSCNDNPDVNSYATVEFDTDAHTIVVTGKKVKSGSVTLDLYQSNSNFKLASTTFTVGDKRAKITGATFEDSIPAITTVNGIKLDRVIKKSGIKVDNSQSVTFADPDDSNVLLIRGVDGSIIGNLKLSVLDGDLTPTFGKDDNDNVRIKVDGAAGESGTIRITVNKLSGIEDDAGVPGTATSVASKNLEVSDLNVD